MKWLVLLLVAGCATPDVMCDMKADYAMQTPMNESGNVRVVWKWRSELPFGVYGQTRCERFGSELICQVRMKGPPPKFSDVCALARLGHETLHAMGARH